MSKGRSGLGTSSGGQPRSWLEGKRFHSSDECLIWPFAASSSFMVSYDSGADVLYLSRMSERAARSREDKYGVVWRYDREGKLIGATVLDFYEIWSADTSVLVERLSKRFEIPTPQAQVVLDHALSLHRSEN